MVQGVVQFLVKMKSDEAVNNTKTLKKELDETGQASEQTEKRLSAINAVKFSAINTATSALTSAMGGAVKAAGNYSYEFARVNMLTGANTKEAASLERQMLNLGAQTTLTTEQVAEAAQELGALGFNAEDTSKALEGVVKAAEGTGASTTDVAKTMASIEKQFGLTADSSEHLADVLTVSANESAADVAYMGDAFKYVGKDADNLGMSVEETAAVIMVLADNGLAASQAGTGLRSVIKNLSAPTDAAAAAMDDLGVSVYESDGSFRGFSTVIDDLSKAFSGLSDEERNNYARAIAGKTASAAFLTVLDGGSGTIEDYQEALENSTGAADEASSVLRNTLTAQFDSLFGSITNVVYAILSLLEPAIVKIIEGITTLLGWIQNLILDFRDWVNSSELVTNAMDFISEHSELVIKAIAAIIAISLIYFGVNAIVTSGIFAKVGAWLIEIATSAWVTLQMITYNAVAFITSALYQIITGRIIIKVVQMIIEITASISLTIYQTILNAVEFISVGIKGLMEQGIIKVVVQKIIEIAKTIIQIAVNVALNIVWYAQIAVTVLIIAAVLYLIVTHDGLKAIVLLVIGVFVALYTFFVNNILPILMKLAQFIISTVIPAFVEIVKEIAAQLLPILQQLWEFFVGSILPILQKLATLIVSIVVPALVSIWNTISPLLLPVLELLGTIIMGTVIVALEAMKAALDFLLPPIESLCTWIGDKLDAAINAVKPALEWLGDKFSWIADIVSSLASGIGGVVDSIGGFIGGIFSSAPITVQRSGAAFDDTQTIAYRNMSGFGQIHGSGLETINNSNTSYNDNRQLQVVVNSVEEANEIVDKHADWKEMIKG